MMLKFNSADVKEKIEPQWHLPSPTFLINTPNVIKPFRPSFNHKILLGTAFSLVSDGIPENRSEESRHSAKKAMEKSTKRRRKQQIFS